jgi:tRNA(Leu) C34 or U34 (ribose-2'-O)-methylase TrmL
MRKDLHLKELLYFLNVTVYGVTPVSSIQLNDRNCFLFGPEEEGNRCDLD